MRNSPVPVTTRFGSFRDHLNEITTLAKNHTVFVYLDPFRPSQLLFDDMRSVYDQLHTGQSVETLINFMSWGLLRAILGSMKHVMIDSKLQTDHPHVIRFNQITGGTYWQRIVFDPSLSQSVRADQIANGYANQLRRWFKYVLTYPIREKYQTKSPKYHLVFGSRSHHAFDLMNRAMVKARREFIKAGFIKGFLFPNQPDKEVIKPEEIMKVIIETSLKVGKTSWTNLRVNATIASPCLYTDSEFNRAIKQAIQKGHLNSNCSGTKVEDYALVWPLP
jgi:hypothetical protein